MASTKNSLNLVQRFKFFKRHGLTDNDVIGPVLEKTDEVCIGDVRTCSQQVVFIVCRTADHSAELVICKWSRIRFSGLIEKTKHDLS